MNAAAKPSKPLISVCIPTYEMHGLGATFLSESLEILSRQSLRDFNVIISDHSRDGTIRAVCESFSGRLDIRYHHNPEKRGNLSANFNNMIRHADGRLVKMLMQDDYLVGENSLAFIAREFDLEKDFWLVTSSHNTRDGKSFFDHLDPFYHEKIHLGWNTISTPSVLTFRNEEPLLFDENLTWLTDCDYYRRAYDRFGLPKFLHQILVTIRQGKHQVSTAFTKESSQDPEFLYLARKHGEDNPELLLLKRKARRLLKHAKAPIKKILRRK